MASLTIPCECGKVLTVAERHRGRRIKCRQCGTALRVPESRLAVVVKQGSLGFLAVACLLALLLWERGDVWWTATILLFIGRWIFLLPLAVLVPAAAIYSRRMLVPLALGALIVVGPVMGFRTGWRRLIPHPPGEHMRVITFNVDGGELMVPQLPGLLVEWQPDVMAIQECGENLTEVVHVLQGWYHHETQGLCLISRYPILSAQAMDRSGLAILAENEKAGIGGSGDVVRYTLQTPRGPVTFTNLHLETPRKGLEGLLNGTFKLGRLEGNTELRGIESDLARKWVNQGTPPTLVAGDFNTPVESQIFQDHWGDLADAFSTAGFGLGMTRNNGWIKARIDHVLTGPGWYPEHVAIGRDVGSDHLPVIVDLTLVR
jgi:vancomycin resistance protein VanJ